MIIYTSQGNPLGLKLLILSKLAKKEVTVKVVNFTDTELKEIKHLPILQLDSGIEIFSPNAAAKYLLESNEKNKELINEWLEWSSTLLTPALCYNMGVGHHININSLNVLNALIEKLEHTLKSQKFVCGAELTIADIAIWSLLTPSGTLKAVKNIGNIIKWYNKISELDEVKSALNFEPFKELSFSSLQHSNCLGGLNHITLPQIQNDSVNCDQSPHLSADSPTHIAETISEDEIALAKVSFIYEKQHDIKEPKTVLPKKGERNILITSALPYVNNVPHLGNIIGCVLSADIFARYSRLCGYNTLYICGTDEYGTATETKAMTENLTPKQICDKYFDIHNGIYRWFGIGFDYFGRTTTPEQTEIVQTVFKELYEKGYIITESVEQLLCQKCDRYLADRFVEGTCPHPGCGYEDARGDQCDKCGKLVNATELIRPRCKICTTAPVLRHSEQLFLNLPKIEPKLREWVEKTEHGWTNNAKVITRSWLKEGLKPRCITRDLKWGITVPLKGFETKVFYVWFDAPFGYISITSRYTKEYKKWWQPEEGVNVELYQFMAKDNVPFHSVMFPASLLAINKGYTLVSHIMATEYLNYEDGKFSKSRGVGVFGNDAQDTGIPSDVWRFYLASARPEGQDSSFSWSDLGARNNSELLNNLGNFVNRALVFCEKNFNSTVPNMLLTNDDYILLALVNREIKGYVNSMEKAKFRDGIRHILSISRHGNQYMQSTQPWVLLKETSEKQIRAGTVIGICCNLSCILATLLFPFMPSTSRIIYNQLNTTPKQINVDKSFVTILLPPGHKIDKPSPLFQKINQNRIDELKKKYSGSQNQQTIIESSNISNKVAFKTIIEAEEAIRIQGDKVRSLKITAAEKKTWQPEVNILLDMKKQLAQLQINIQDQNCISPNQHNTAGDKNKIKELEDKIKEQGNKVRSLKATSDPPVWKPEVEILLNLKKKLAELTGTLVNATSLTSNKNK